MPIKKLIIKTAIARIYNHQKFKAIKSKKKRKHNAYKEQMIAQFGRLRWYLSYWFGSWVLWIGVKHNA